MKPNVLYSACCALIFVTTPAAATTPTAAKLAQRMKVALEPARPSVRKMSIVISTQDGEATRWTVGQARKHSKDGNRTVTVVLEPADQRGIAFLMRESDGRSDLEQWVYIPVVRRVRRILPLESLQTSASWIYVQRTSSLGLRIEVAPRLTRLKRFHSPPTRSGITRAS